MYRLFPLSGSRAAIDTPFETVRKDKDVFQDIVRQNGNILVERFQEQVRV